MQKEINKTDSANLVKTDFSADLKALGKVLQNKPGDIETLKKMTELFLEKNDHRKSFLSEQRYMQNFSDIGNLPLSSFRDKYKGKRIFIIGNGPSIKDTPLDLLRNEYTFAMNRIALTYRSTKWRPSFFLCTTTNVARPDWNKDIRESIELGIPSFVWRDLKSYLPPGDNVFYVDCTYGTQVTEYAPDEWWSDDIENAVCKFGTSMLPVLQIAMYMGFESIYLLGCDLGFTENTDSLCDQNHFHSGYGTPGFSAAILNVNMKAAHELTLRAAKRKKVQIYNATIGGELEVYPRVNFFDVVKQGGSRILSSQEKNSKPEPDNLPIASIKPASGSFIELLDPHNIDPIAYDQGLLAEIRQFSLLPGRRIGWNYCLDYTWLALQCHDCIKPGMRIVDIGCGSGATHGYLENRYGVEILGIDMKKWESDYVDIVGDFSIPDLRQKWGLEKKSVDVIISTSAFEHNTPENHELLVKACYETLKPSGRLIATFSVAMTLSYEKSAHQWNLTREQLESIYNVAFTGFDYYDVWKRWQNHREIPRAYAQRYGAWRETDPSFLSVGVVLIKDGK